MAIDKAMIKKLRTMTGAGILDCRKALTENDGDFDKSVDWLRARGIAKAAKKAGRAATEGLVYSYIHTGGRIQYLILDGGVINIRKYGGYLVELEFDG